MNRKKFASCFSAVMLLAIVLAACTAEDINSTDIPQKESVPVEVSVLYDGAITRAPGDATLSVNRILLLPFRKTDESLADTPDNYVPEYSAARQLTIHSFPVVATKLTLQAASTYQVVILGYNWNDYDFNNQSSASRRFDLGSTSPPTTLANVYGKPLNPAYGVPEFFSSQCTGYMNGNVVGNTFRPSQVNQLQGILKRIVSGYSLKLTDIPDYVTSITLVAEKLVTATRITDGTALQWQTTTDGSPRTLGTLKPVSGTVNFNYYLLAIPNAQQTLFYLDVSYGIFTERYTVQVADNSGTVSDKRFTLLPNHWIKVTGSYSSINLGFTITDNINLDDNAWDGIQ